MHEKPRISPNITLENIFAFIDFPKTSAILLLHVLF